VALEGLEDRTLPSVNVVETFDGGSLAGYQTALRYAPSAAVLPVAAHDGLAGLVKQDGYEWLIRNDPSAQVHVGDTLSVWVQLAAVADGRAYLGFDAKDNGAAHSPLTDGGMLSVVMAANTSQLLIQNNAGFNEPVSSATSAVAAVSQTYQPDQWYRLEATWGAGGAITGRLYDSDGVTLLNTVSGTTTAPFSSGGGYAFRAFGHDKYFDTVVVDTGSTGAAADRAFAGGGLSSGWVGGSPPPPVGNNPGGAPAPVPWQYAATPGSGRDVTLADFSNLQQVPTGGIVGGVVGLAAQNISAVGGTQQISWGPPAGGPMSFNGALPLETPLLAGYLFRQLPGDQTRLIGASDVKHFFSSSHTDTHHLNPGEQGTYSSSQDMTQALYTDGSEIDPGTGTLHSPVGLGHTDADGVAIQERPNFATRIQHLLQVNVADLDPAQNPSGTRWFLMGNVFVAGDQDTNNNSRWVEIIPHFNGTTFTFTYPDGAGGHLDFRTIPGLATPGAGPAAISSSPSGGSNLASLSSASVTFDRPIDPTTFVPATSVVSFTGPDGAHAVTSATPAAGSGNRTFTLAFDAPLAAAGTYTLVIGPDIRDTAGNQMDQNGNGIAGEVPDDEYTLTFGIQGLGITASASNGNVPGQVYSQRLTFNAPVDVNSFSAASVVSLTGPDGPHTAFGAAPVAGSNFTQWDVVFPPLTAAGSYSLVVSGFVADVWGNRMGADVATTFALITPQVTGSTPTGTVSVPPAVDHARLTFDRPMDPTTLVPALFTFTGPGGVSIPVTAVAPVPGTNGTRFDVSFDPQTAAGAYVLVLAPGAADIYGNFMPAGYTTQFNVQPSFTGYTVTTTAFQNINIFGQSGTQTLVFTSGDVTADDDFGTLALPGTNTFTFYGQTYNQLFVSSNGTISFGSGYSENQPTNLITGPPLALIAPYWTDLIKTGTEPMVLWRVSGGQLTIQWYNVSTFPEGSSIRMTWQVILDLNTGSFPGAIVFNYVTATGVGAQDDNFGITVGIKEAGGRRTVVQDGSTGGHGDPRIGSGRALLFTPG
jgi:hypothetical protein